ncbi:MAG: hypothetical protein C00003105_00972 [ANME-2 cluster archaeon HR1]|nr:MAG: hypothetical protein C00003105_00972 [ANME-2 cluster archaeon HR1]
MLLIETKVKDLTVVELHSLISDTVKGTMEDFIEDILALSSDDYLHSINEARSDYKEGRVKNFEEIFDV